MQRFEITEYDINQVLNDKLPIDYWYFKLGVGYVYEFTPDGIQFRMPYEKIGPGFWAEIEATIHHFICCNGSPRPWVEELISGEIRNTIVGFVSAITAKFDIGMGIAVPIAALILKRGIANYCVYQPQGNTNVDIKSFVENDELKY